jgi:pimeloyl-ACP methyl ester carboxylesterase
LTKTIVLLHGAYVGTGSWDQFAHHYEAEGYTVVVPPWPGEKAAVEARKNPDPGLRDVGVGEIVASYAGVIRSLPEPPILMGHSYGGLFVQILLDQGLGAAGVAIDPAPPRGVWPSMRMVSSATPSLMGAGAKHGLTLLEYEPYAKNFANGASAALARAEWERTAIPTPCRIFRQSTFLSKYTGVDWDGDRAPLLILSGGDDRTVTARVNHKNYFKYRKSDATTEYLEFEGRSHATIFEPGWEKVADYALDWAERVLSLGG